MATNIPYVDTRIIVNLLDGQEIVCQEINDGLYALLSDGECIELVADNINYICVQTTINHRVETKTVYNKISE